MCVIYQECANRVCCCFWQTTATRKSTAIPEFKVSIMLYQTFLDFVVHLETRQTQTCLHSYKKLYLIPF